MAVKDSLIYSLGNISTKVIGLVLLPLYTKELAVSEYGVLGTLEITLQVIIALFSFSFYQALNRWYWDKDYKNRQNSIFFTALAFVIAMAVFMSGFIIVLSEPLAVVLLNDACYSYLIALMVISAALQIVSQIPLTLMRLQRKVILFAVSNIIKLAITLILTIYFIVYRGKKVDGIFEAQIIGFVFLLLINSRFVMRNVHLRFEYSIFREMLQFSYPLMISSVGGVILTVADRYTVRFIKGMNDVGIYSLGFKIANILKILIIHSVGFALTPIKLRMMDRPDNKRFYSKSLTYTVFGFSIFMMIVAFFGKEIVVILAQDPSYWQAHQIIPILCFAQLFELMRRSTNIGLIISKKTRVISKILLLMTALNIPLNIILIMVFDIIGAAIATLSVQALLFIAIYRNAQRYYHIPYEMKKVGKIIMVLVLLIAISYIVNDLFLVPRTIIKGMMIIVFPIVLYFWNFYEPIELLHLKQSWNKWKNPKDWGRNIRNIRIR